MQKLATGYVSIAQARGRLIERLFPAEDSAKVQSSTREHWPMIAARRIWQALREQRLRAEQSGQRVASIKLDDQLFHDAFASDDMLRVRADEFQTWLSTVSPLTELPQAAHMTAVEAASFLAYGAFFTTDDYGAMFLDDLMRHEPRSSDSGGWPPPQWETAERRLFDAHVNGKLTLTARNQSAPEGKRTAIPKDYFADRMTLLWSNYIRVQISSGQPAPTFEMWHDVMVATGEFVSAFPAQRDAGGSQRGAKPKYDWNAIGAEATKLMDYHGDFDPRDAAWNAQARLEQALLKLCQNKWQEEPALGTLRPKLRVWLKEWRAKKRMVSN